MLLLPIRPSKRLIAMNLKQIKTLLTLAIIVVVLAYQFFNPKNQDSQIEQLGNVESPQLESQTALLNKIRQARENTDSRFWLTIEAKVVKILKDDRRGSQHQRFLISPAKDITLLVAHNIDLAKYVPLSVGDKVKIRGRYEWNNRGGVVHWTHHDTKGRKEGGGWIYHDGKYYK